MTSRGTKISLVLLLSALPMAAVHAAEGSAEPPFRFYSTVDGLTQSDVYDMAQDSAGYLWFTTARGLNRYDGKEFEHYTLVDGLPSNNLTALTIDADDTVWVGDTSGGVAVIRSARIEHVIEPLARAAKPVIDLQVAGDRVLLIVQDAGIMEIVPEGAGYRIEPIGGESIGATNMAVFGNDVWVASKFGLYRLAFKPKAELQLVNKNIIAVHAAADGTIWVVTREKRIGIWKNGSIDVRAIIDTVADRVSLTTDGHNTVWVATGGQLFSFDGNKANVVQTLDTIQAYDGIDSISSMFVDRENTLWLAGESRLIRYLGERFRHFRLKTESDSETVWSISEDNSGHIWFGTQTKLLRLEVDETLTLIGPERGIPRGPVRDVVRGTAGAICGRASAGRDCIG